MEFIVLSKFKRRRTKENTAEGDKLLAGIADMEVKFKKLYRTLGKYDAVAIVEAKDEKTVMKTLLTLGDIVSTQTLVAVPRDEAVKLLE